MQEGSRFLVNGKNFYYASYDRFNSAGKATGHYFWQDLWAARCLYNKGIIDHVDIGSRIDGFITHILPFCRVTYVDYRLVNQLIPNFFGIQASILALPFKSHSIHSLSCLHVIEHIGLGRYGDSIDPYGYEKAANELVRVLHKNGVLFIGTPVGKEKLCFDAHRIFDPKTIENIFSTLELKEFSLVDDRGQLIQNSNFETARQCDYGCGLFIFRPK